MDGRRWIMVGTVILVLLVVALLNLRDSYKLACELTFGEWSEKREQGLIALPHPEGCDVHKPTIFDR